MRILVSTILFVLTGVPSIVADDSVIVEKSWTINGVERKALICVPFAVLQTHTPLIFAFHGHGGNMRNAAERFAFQKRWPEAISVYMQGLPTPGKLDPEGKLSGWQKTSGDQDNRDLEFFDAVLASLKTIYDIDEKRVYATGHSNGGGFTYLLWATRGDVLAAIAPSAAGAGRNLKGLKPMPVLHVAGENDRTVPFENQRRTMEAVRRLNGCDAEGTPWAKAGNLIGTQYASKTGAPFVSVIHSGAHVLPAEAPELIAKFFKEQRKP